ncbi:28S ribosomal protein S10, mitochondrial-like [Uloborus diversus]|uniref:28S ribosomal protein S10, mitochondrial-like n=1 Tax=Uloborus diversus TaxID=327109 RepID=UPI00240A3892|nr:28S ribosomal protein S10, mitochondrial-like [Uloborus diversus]
MLRNIFKFNTQFKKAPRPSSALFSTLKDISHEIQNPPVLDDLYSKMVVEVRGHDRAVLNSYEWFTKTAANELGVNITNISEPKKFHDRRTLLKSAFVHKKHRVQYEFRTYFRIFEMKHLTGSTADTFLEYIQRNLPEGVSMKVTKHRIEKLPDHIKNYVPEKTEEKNL